MMRILQRGLLAAVVVGALGAPAKWARGDGEVSFEPFREFYVEPSLYAIAAGDFNGDGHFDVVVNHVGVGAPWTVLFGDGEGSFGEPLDFAASSAARIVPVDIDNDGDLDLLGPLVGLGKVQVFFNVGQGHFHNLYDFTVKNGSPIGIAAGDFDGDGDNDVATLNNNGTVSVAVNDGRGAFRLVDQIHATQSAPFYPVGNLVAADIDGDGDLDLVGGSTSEPNIVFLRNDRDESAPGGVNFEFRRGPLENIPTIPQGARNIAVGDLDGDGDLDIFSVSGNEELPVQLQVVLNDGGGRLSLGWGQSQSAMQAENVALADMDLDGDLDAVFVVPNGINLILNDGAGNFASPGAGWFSSEEVSPRPVTLVVVDLDHDGDMDVLVPNQTSVGTIGVLLNSTSTP